MTILQISDSRTFWELAPPVRHTSQQWAWTEIRLPLGVSQATIRPSSLRMDTRGIYAAWPPAPADPLADQRGSEQRQLSNATKEKG